MFLRIVWSRIRPKRFRSSVTKPIPCLIAENRHQQIGATGAHQARYAQHLTTTHRKADPVDQQLAADGWIFDRDVASRKNLFAALVFGFGKDFSHFASHHLRNHARLIDGTSRIGADSPAVTQNRDAIAEAKHLVELVRNIDHCDAAVA